MFPQQGIFALLANKVILYILGGAALAIGVGVWSFMGEYKRDRAEIMGVKNANKYYKENVLKPAQDQIDREAGMKAAIIKRNDAAMRERLKRVDSMFSGGQ